jgi:hypothetical protein
MSSTVEHAGLQDAEEKFPLTPGGSPEALKETAWVVPDTNEAAIESLPEEPAVTAILPELDKEKSKGWVTVNEALAWALGLYPFSNAAALTVALLVNVIAPL